MNKTEFVIFLTTNAVMFVVISIIFMVTFVTILTMKAKKINDMMDKAEKIAQMYEIRLNAIDKDSYSINKYNKATLEYIKEFREILVAHKGKTFDTQLLKAIDNEMQEKLTKEKYKDINNFKPKNEFTKNVQLKENHIPNTENDYLPFIQPIQNKNFAENTIELDADSETLKPKIKKTKNIITDRINNIKKYLIKNPENNPHFKTDINKLPDKDIFTMDEIFYLNEIVGFNNEKQ